MNLTSVRQEIADSLSSEVANIYFFPPATIITPAVIVVPDSGIYIEPLSIGARKYKARFRLTICVAMRDNQSALENIENLIFGVYESLPNGYIVLDATSPSIVNLGQADILTSEVTVEKIVTAS